jgi:hypothetical protein
MGSVTTPSRWTSRKSTTCRGRAWVAFIVALLVLALAAPADAKKKKKGGKKGKTPSGKTSGKSTGATKAVPDDETDDASDDEKEPTPSKPPVESSPVEEKPPADADETPKPKKPAKEKPPEPEDADGSGLPALTFGVGGKALFRSVAWTGDMGMLAPYSLSPGPEVALWGEVYPMAFMSTGFAANIGLYGGFNYGIGAKSRTPAGTELTTAYQDFLVGLKVRIPLGMFIPYVAGAYGVQGFKLDPSAMDRPNFSYAFFRPGAGARIQATPMVDIDIGVGPLIVLGLGTAVGEVKAPQFYPRSTAFGIDANLSVGIRFSSLIGVRVGADFRQYGLATNYMAGTGSTIVAAGATDRYITAWGGLELILDGMGGGPGGGDDEPAPAKKPAAKKKPAADDFADDDKEKEAKEEE